MKGKLIATIAIFLIFISTFYNMIPITPIKAQGTPETIEVSQPKQLTTSPLFDRNPSYVKAASGAMLVFFARGRGDPTLPGYNPDTDYQDICYAKSIDNGLTWAERTLPSIPDGHGLGAFTPAALKDDTDKIWVFYAANGVGTFYFTSTDNGETWIGPTAVPNVDGFTVWNHLDAIKANDGKIWVFYHGDPSSAIYARKFDGTTWSSPIVVGDTLGYTATPRALQEADDIFRVVYIAGDPLQIFLASSTDGTIWTQSPIINTDNDDYDPVLVKDGTTWRLFFAPYIPADDHQWLMTTSSPDLSTWSSPVMVTAGSYGAAKWWDFYPEAVTVSSELILFYASMKDGFQRGDGEICMFKVDWDATHDHYEAIKPAIDAASQDDMIIVHSSTYTEGPQFIINKNLGIVGTEASTTIIKPAGDTGSSGDARGWFLITAGVTFNLSSLTLDGSGHNIYQAIRDNGQGTITNCIFKSISYPSYQGFAIVAFGGNVDVINCTFMNIGRVGVLYYGSVVSNSVFSGNSYTGKGDGDWLDYGVEVGAGAHVAVAGNTISECTGIAAVDNSTSAGVLVTTYYGAGSQATIINNDISGCSYGIAVGYDETDTSSVVAYMNNLYNNDWGIDTTAPAIDARFNWWGNESGPPHSSNPSGTGDKISDYVDYSPWLGDPFETTPRTYHVNPTGTIQEAIDEASSGDTVTVHTGTYDEQVVINKSLTLQGVGETTIVKPSSAAKLTKVFDGLFWYGSPNTKQIAGIIVANVPGGSNVIIKNLKVDESSVTTKPAGADYLTGIFYRETAGTIDTVKIVGTGAWSGSDRAFGMYLSAATNTALVQITGSTITNYDKNGIEAMGNKLTVNVHHNTITGRGPISDEVQNGVDVGRDAVGMVNYNTISNLEYQPKTWWAAAIMFYHYVSPAGVSGSAQGNTITNCQIGIIFKNVNAWAQDNTVAGGTVGLVGIYAEPNYAGAYTASFVNNTVSGVSGDENAAIGANTYATLTPGTGASLTITIGNNQLIGGGSTNADGVYVDGSAGSVTATISGNIISGWNHGINLASACVAGATIIGNTIENNLGTDSGIHIEPAVNVTNIHINYNNIFGNNATGAYGIFNDGTGVLDARYNWWGHPTGPYHLELNPSGKGDKVSDNVNFEPWLLEPYPPPKQVEALLHVDPPETGHWTPSYGETFTVNIKITNVTDLFGYEFKLYWNTVLLDLTGVQITPPWSTYTIGKNEIREDLGRYWLAVGAYGVPTFNGSTTLAKLTFKITFDPIYPENKTCKLDLADTKLSAPDGVPIYHMIHDGKYIIYSRKPLIKVEPPTYTACSKDETFEVYITVLDVVNLYNFSFQLSYNTTLLDAIDLKIDPFLNSPRYVSKNIIDDANGLIWLWVWSLPPAPPTNGTGILATITFKAAKSTTWTKYHPNILSCALDLHDTLLVTDKGVEVAHDVNDGAYRYEPKPGDLDRDGHVGLTDLRFVAYYYDPAYNAIADLNEDGVVDIYDLTIVATHYGEDC